jgi:hypothetical protein
MSEKRSWDIQPKQRPLARPASFQQPAPQAQARPAARREPPARIPKQPKPPKPPKQVKQPRQKERRQSVQQGREREPLKDRRRRERRRSSIFTILFIVLAIVGIIAFFWIPAFRIQHVSAAGPDVEGMQVIASSVLSGRDHFVFPRNSIFLFPASELRASILKQYPDISAVSISRTSLNSISVASIPREQAFVWCGVVYAPAPVIPVTASSTQLLPASPTSSCYSADGQGVIFASLVNGPLISPDFLSIYAPLESSADNIASPLGASISQAHSLSNVLQFIKILKSLGAPIVTVAIRGDEVDFFTQNHTRITYVLGREEMARQLAESSFSSLSPGDGSLEYIDLRFDGKVYSKKVGGSAQAANLTPSPTSH